jgi:pimeloyl-ACP methyl ester carboxylesterase
MLRFAPLVAFAALLGLGRDAFAQLGGDRRVGDVYAAGDDSTFVFDKGGARVGEHWWVYDGTIDLAGVKAHRFEGGARVEQVTALGKFEVRESGDLVVDERGHPLRLALRIQAAGSLSTVDATFADGKATLDVVKGGAKQRLVRPVPPDAFVLVNQWVGMIELAAALAPPPEGASRTLKLFAVEAATTIDFELRDQGPFETSGRKIRDSLGELLMVERSGKLFKLAIPAQGLELRHPRAAPRRGAGGGETSGEDEDEGDRAEKVERFVVEVPKLVEHDFLREEVVATNGPARLAGTITKRKGAARRLPAVFFVSGSGPQDRDGFSGPIDLGTHELLDRLTEEGFLVLRVDDRGVGASRGPTAHLSYDDLVADARACVDLLLARDDVDHEHVFVIGHSEGGETAPILACERELAGIVLMAPPGRSLFAILREQNEAALVAAGLPKALVESELEEHRKALEILAREPAARAGGATSEALAGDDDTPPSELRLDFRGEWRNRAWYRGHARHDPIAQVKLVKCPVLIVQGDLDRQVSAERDAVALADALREAGHRDATLRRFPRLDHLFKRVPGETPSFADYLTARPLDPEFLDVVSAWLKERRGPQ